MKCPNCFDQIEEYDLVGNEFGITHCGCFYESNPDKVRWHFMKEIETEDYNSVTMERLHNLSEMLSCTKFEIESKEAPIEDNVIMVIMEWKDAYALATTP